MFPLILSILSSGLIALIMRFGSDRVSNPLGMLLANYLVCTGLGVFYTDFQIYLPQAAGYFPMLGMSLLNGVIYLAAFVTYQSMTQKSGIVLASIFMKLGLLVPMVLPVFLFREYPNTVQIFKDFGMGCLGCAIAHFETLEQGVNAHGIDLDAILCELSMAATNYENEEATKCKCGCGNH